jgi:hypothetical protein
MNSFDAAIAIGLIVAVITGFNAGLLRSGVTILAYLIAMPIAVWAMSMLYRRHRTLADAEFTVFLWHFSHHRPGAGKVPADGGR